jgi:hypothetical protein
MTEFELALEFLQAYVRSATIAAEAGEPFDEGRGFRRFCDDLGVEPTAERGELIRDLAGVINECVRRGEDERDEEVADPGGRVIPTACLTGGLEQHGWRLAYLTKDLHD